MPSHEASSGHVFDYLLYDRLSVRRTSIREPEPLSVHECPGDDDTLSAIRATARENQPEAYPFHYVTQPANDGVMAELHLELFFWDYELPKRDPICEHMRQRVADAHVTQWNYIVQRWSDLTTTSSSDVQGTPLYDYSLQSRAPSIQLSATSSLRSPQPRRLIPSDSPEGQICGIIAGGVQPSAYPWYSFTPVQTQTALCQLLCILWGNTAPPERLQASRQVREEESEAAHRAWREMVRIAPPAKVLALATVLIPTAAGSPASDTYSAFVAGTT